MKIKLSTEMHKSQFKKKSSKKHTCREWKCLGEVTSAHRQTLVNTHTKNTSRSTQRAAYSHGLVRLPLWSFNLHGSTLIPNPAHLSSTLVTLVENIRARQDVWIIACWDKVVWGISHLFHPMLHPVETVWPEVCLGKLYCCFMSSKELCSKKILRL